MRCASRKEHCPPGCSGGAIPLLTAIARTPSPSAPARGGARTASGGKVASSPVAMTGGEQRQRGGFN